MVVGVVAVVVVVMVVVVAVGGVGLGLVGGWTTPKEYIQYFVCVPWHTLHKAMISAGTDIANQLDDVTKMLKPFTKNRGVDG